MKRQRADFQKTTYSKRTPKVVKPVKKKVVRISKPKDQNVHVIKNERELSVEEKAESLVGYDTWHSLNYQEKYDMIADLINRGAIELNQDELQGLKKQWSYYDGGSISMLEKEIITPDEITKFITLQGHEKTDMLKHLAKKYKWGKDDKFMFLKSLHGEEKFAEGSMIADKIKIVYKLKGSPDEKEKIFQDAESVELFKEAMEDDLEIIKEEIYKPEEATAAPAPKPNLFAAAKKAPAKSSAKAEKESVEVIGIAEDIARYDALDAIIKNAKAEQELIGGNLKQIGKEKFLELYEKRGKNPDTFNLADLTEKIMFIVMDKYKKVEPEKVAILEQEKYEGLLEESVTYSFNPDILNRVGQAVSDMITESKLISEEDKANLIVKNTSLSIKKGAIDRLLEYDNPREVFDLIEPIMALK
jgi:hypothetical protein